MTHLQPSTIYGGYVSGTLSNAMTTLNFAVLLILSRRRSHSTFVQTPYPLLSLTKSKKEKEKRTRYYCNKKRLISAKTRYICISLFFSKLYIRDGVKEP